MRNCTKQNLEIKFLIIFFIVFMTINFFFDKTNLEHEVMTLEKNWTVKINDELYKDVDLSEFSFKPANKGDVFILFSTLPKYLPDNPLLSFYTVRSDIRVDVDGNTIYQFGQDLYQEDKLNSYGYHLIPLSPEMAGQSLRVTLRISENSAFSSFVIPQISNSVYYFRDFCIKNRLVICVLIFLIIFALILLVVATVYSMKSSIFYKLLCISMFSICIGLWSFCSHDLTVLFSYNPLVKSYLEFISLYIAPIFVFGYFAQEALFGGGKLRKYTYLTILIAQAAFITIAIVFQILNIVHLPAFLTVSHVLMAVMIIYILSIFIHDIRSKKVAMSPALFFGFSTAIIFFMIDLIRFNLQKYTNIILDDHYTSKIYIGMFIFCFSLIIDFCSNTIISFYKNVESATLEKMAYTDYLTGLINRRKLEELFDEIDRNPTSYAVGVFDLNDLKEVNDTLGHNEGDRYIKEFSQVLKKTFQDIGIVGRTGGDEFLVIIKNAKNLNIDRLISKMYELLEKVNEENPTWNMSAAYGFCFADEEGVDSVRGASKIADWRMYQKKIEMKYSVYKMDKSGQSSCDSQVLKS